MVIAADGGRDFQRVNHTCRLVDSSRRLPRLPREPTIGVTNRLNTALSGRIPKGEGRVVAILVGQACRSQAIVFDCTQRKCNCEIPHWLVEHLIDKITITGGHLIGRDMRRPIRLVKSVHFFASR